jgi:uncharacterized protein YxjI
MHNNQPYSLTLVQKLTMMQNQWVVTRTDGTPIDIGVISQKRMSLKESVTCTTADGAAVLFRIQGRKVLEIGGTYDVFDGDGVAIGLITKDFKASLGRSTYAIETAAGRWTLTEASQVQAVMRRVMNLVSDIPWLMRMQFSLVNESGVQVGHVNRANMKIKDTYDIRVDDGRLDMRMAAAMGVAVDAFMNR